MKAVRHFSHNLHVVLLTLALVAVAALITFSGVQAHAVVVSIVCAAVIVALLFEVDAVSEHFTHDKF